MGGGHWGVLASNGSLLQQKRPILRKRVTNLASYSVIKLKGRCKERQRIAH